MRLIFDTNTLVSRLFLSKSVPAQAFSKGLQTGLILMSDDTLMELTEVLSRDKFDKYISLEDRKQSIRMLGRIIETVSIIRAVRECRDPKDDKFLELAVNGEADLLITSDSDLLGMKEFHGTRIITAKDFINMK